MTSISGIELMSFSKKELCIMLKNTIKELEEKRNESDKWAKKYFKIEEKHEILWQEELQRLYTRSLKQEYETKCDILPQQETYNKFKTEKL